MPRQITEDGQISFSLSLKQIWGIVAAAVVGIATAAIFIYRIESARVTNEARWTAQASYNLDNTRAHAVIDSLVNVSRWKIRRLERKAGLKTRDEEDGD